MIAVVGLTAFLPAQTRVVVDKIVADKEVQVSGHRLHYLESGAGPPVILLHGLGADVRAWRFTIPVLAENFHVYALDQIGFGQSEKPEISYRVSTLVDALLGFQDVLGIKKASLVGNSLGGWVAALAATSHADRVDKLVLVDAAGYGEDPAQLVREFLSQLDPNVVAAAEQLLSSLNPGDQRVIEAAAASYFARRMGRNDGFAVASLAESFMRGDDVLGPEVKQLRAPTLVVWGRDDKTIPLRAGEAFGEDIPGARLVVLDHCGHRPQIECAPAFNAAVKPFLLGETNPAR